MFPRSQKAGRLLAWIFHRNLLQAYAFLEFSHIDFHFRERSDPLFSRSCSYKCYLSRATDPFMAATALPDSSEAPSCTESCLAIVIVFSSALSLCFPCGILIYCMYHRTRLASQGRQQAGDDAPVATQEAVLVLKDAVFD